jgi:phenylacetate-CoA ligase
MYLIHGDLSATFNVDDALTQLLSRLPATLSTPVSLDALLTCAGKFSAGLCNMSQDLGLDDKACAELSAFCSSDALTTKLRRELGETPFSLRRIDYRNPYFEAWRPLGLVVHVTPGNASLLPFCAVLEGLLVGNVNWLRPSSSDGGLTARLLSAFLSHDTSGELAAYVAVLPVAPPELSHLLLHADGVSAWGGDVALAAIRKQAPAACRWIDWGHRISFVYLTPVSSNSATLDAIVDEVCLHDQQACSSPQLVLVDSDDPDTLRHIGEQLAQAFQRRAPHWLALTPDEQEAADITSRTAFARLDQVFGDTPGQVWQGVGWRILWSHEAELAPSPLFRTILLRPVPRLDLVRTLRVWRSRLQSCGLAADDHDQIALSQILLAAGVGRIAPLGAMHDGYLGEPHDGVYALARLARRISVTLPVAALTGHATLDMPPPAPDGLDGVAQMNKEAFQFGSLQAGAQLFFRSGGSSGVPKLAGFTYRDYHRQMRAAADGLFAAGVDPARDRVMNLLYGGNLYGGLLSFFTVLDKLGVPHYPMAGPTKDNFSEIARIIMDQGVDTLVGMPSTVYQLFLREPDLLREYGGIRKLMLGGEYLASAQRAYIESFGVTTIRSAIYGSVDAGPLGHACQASPNGVFHLMTDTQWLEIVAQDADLPVAMGETGRLLFTSRAREGQRVVRYDIGDLGRWVTGDCACGLPSPRFQLLGRHGQLVRLGSSLMCPALLAELAQVPVQFVFDHAPDRRQRFCVHAEGDSAMVEARLRTDPQLAQELEGGLLLLQINVCPQDDFERSAQSGKTPLFLDKRLSMP